MSQRKPTQTNDDGRLTPQQATAVDLLVSGKTLTDTAAALAVNRETVSGWVNHHAGFQVALNSRRQELWDGQVETLRGLLPKALEVLKQALESDNPLPAAVQVLKSCGLTQGLGRPTGPATVAEVEQAQAKREIERTLTAISAEDVARAQRRREQDRAMAELLL